MDRSSTSGHGRHPRYADELVGFVLRDCHATIPLLHRQWLRQYLRANLSRAEYRLVGSGFGWLRTPLAEGCALRSKRSSAPNRSDLDDEIPF